MVYSAIAFILKGVSKIEDFDKMSIDKVSALVNSGNPNTAIENINAGPERRDRYKILKNDPNLFKCNEN